MIGTELVYSAPLARPSTLGGSPPVYVPWHGGEIRTLSIGDVSRWGKMIRENDFVTFLVADVDGKLYAIDGKGRSPDEEQEIRRRCRKFKAPTSPHMRGWGHRILMEDGQPPPPIRTLKPGETSPRVAAAERR